MKILHTDIFRFSIRMEPFAIATGTMNYAQNVFIRMHTDAGFYGVGECSAFPMIVGETQETCLAMARDFAGIWKGKDPLHIGERLSELHAAAARNNTIKSAFDMALYDIAAKAEGMPLYQYLGGRKRPVETDITIGIDTPEHMARKAAELAAMDATILKVKLGKDPETDISRIRAIREAIGYGCLIRIDANQGWNFEEAVKALTGLEVFNIQFCEQPMRSWNDRRLPELRRLTRIPIMADESCYDHHDAERLIESGSCASINIKFSKSGGIHEALNIHRVARQHDIPCMMGGMLESRIALSAKLHFAMACEGVVYFDLDTCMLGHLEDPCSLGVKFNGFHLDIADNPGIGADADERFLAKCELFSV